MKILNASSSAKLPDMPILFIPNTKEGVTQKVDLLETCIEPFVQECQLLFVDGIEVDYCYSVDMIEGAQNLEKKFTMRVMLVLFSGDHPAQCKFGGFTNGGKSGCRRCRPLTQWKATPGVGVGGMLVYGENRRQQRFPIARKTAEELHDAANAVGLCETLLQKKAIAISTGVTGKTPCWRLFKLYNFNPSTDIIYDPMHILALCIFRKFVEFLKKDIETDPEKRAAFLKALEVVTRRRTTELRGGRWPKDLFSRIGFWKAEEYTKFIIYCLPHILNEVFTENSELMEVGILLTEIGRLFYIEALANGWSALTIQRARQLFSSWRIRSEETFGASGSILEHVAGAIIIVPFPRSISCCFFRVVELDSSFAARSCSFALGYSLYKIRVRALTHIFFGVGQVGFALEFTDCVGCRLSYRKWRDDG